MTLFELAGQVLAWQHEQRPVWLARVVSVTGMGSNDRGEATAVTDGLPAIGQILSGAADRALADALAKASADGAARLLDLRIGDDDAVAVGLTCGGQATVLLQPATGLADTGWRLLASRTPVCLVTDLSDPDLGRTTWLTIGPEQDSDDPVTRAREVVALFGRGTPESAVLDVDDRRLLVTALWPTPQLVVVGEGLIAGALEGAARLLGWEPKPSTT